MRCRPYLCALHVREVAPFVGWRDSGRGWGGERGPSCGRARDLSAPKCGRLSGVAGKSRPRRRRRGREAAALNPDQCRIASCVAVPVIVTRFAVQRLGFGFLAYFVKRYQGLGGLRGDSLRLPPLHPRLGGTGRGVGAPGKGLEVREARGSIPPPRWGRGAGAAGGAGNAALWGGGLHLRGAVGWGGRLPRRGAGPGSGGEGARVQPRRGLAPPRAP